MKNLIINKDYSVLNKTYEINLNAKESVDINYLNNIAENISIEKIKAINDYFKNISIALKTNTVSLFLTDKNKKDYLNYLKQEIHNIVKYDTSYFQNVFPVREALLSKIKKLDNLDIPFYKHDSATGRSKIVAGTNFLTMKKENRKNLTYKNNKIAEVDFNSCEPYFYLLSKNKINSIETDIYDKIKKDLSIKINDRKLLKQSILSILYGAGYETIKRISKIKKEDYDSLKDYFEIDSFEKKLIKEKNDLGYILNFYNRPVIVKSDRSILNYWVQSSVADFCYLSFNEFVKKNKDINFHAIIHDAILFSSKEKININYLICPISKFKIPVSFSYFDE